MSEFTKGLIIFSLGIMWFLSTVWVACYLDSVIDINNWYGFPTILTCFISGAGSVWLGIHGLVKMEHS